eukprot:CAMPEP_0194297806 /NCGR_PEP_ID=MMETSP0169-20130528/59810_1 /TAXON_ID=218684 /ORGANISM="Corethron pennatum, Strain L29A3" /LENGTH=630 /DNA_ID=CAMNT_0039047717 /DNA_START=213 /DNA_END=2103 /DNA_ORIENTATION=+
MANRRTTQAGPTNPGIGIGYEARALDWGDGGKILAVAGSEGVVRIVDAKSFQVVQVLERNVLRGGEEGSNPAITDKEFKRDNTEEATIGKNSLFKMASQSSIATKLSNSGQSSVAPSNKSVMSSVAPSTNKSVQSSVKPYLSNTTHAEEKNEENRQGTRPPHAILADLAALEPSVTPRMSQQQSPKRNRRQMHEQPPSGTHTQIRDLWIRKTSCFLQACDVLLEICKESMPSDRINMFLDAAKMLKMHTKYVSLVDPNYNSRVWSEPCVPFSICHLLAGATEIIEEILDDRNSITQWWSTVKKFNTSEAAINDYNKWNACWTEFDEDAILLNTELLVTVDRKSMDESVLDISQELLSERTHTLRAQETTQGNAVQAPSKMIRQQINSIASPGDNNILVDKRSDKQVLHTNPFDSFDDVLIPESSVPATFNPFNDEAFSMPQKIDNISELPSSDKVEQEIKREASSSREITTQESSGSDFYGIVTGGMYSIQSSEESGQTDRILNFENTGHPALQIGTSSGSEGIPRHIGNSDSKEAEAHFQQQSCSLPKVTRGNSTKAVVKVDNAVDVTTGNGEGDWPSEEPSPRRRSDLFKVKKSNDMFRRKSKKFESDSEDDDSVTRKSQNYDDDKNY